jgi:hypothetical protein
MKKLIIAAVALVSVTSAFARIVTLERSAPVFRKDGRNLHQEVATFLGGTRIDISNRVFKQVGLGPVYKVREVRGYRNFSSNHRYNTAIDINRSRGYVDYFIKASDVDGRRFVEPARPSRRDVIVDRRTPTIERGYEYEVCYERPKTRVTEVMNEKQDRDGRRNRWVGGGLAIGGQILGEITGNRDAGNLISGVGAGILIVGMVQVASANEVFYVDNGVDCRSYYQPDSRRYTFYERGTRCETTRYYTNRWGNVSEYYETTCFGRRQSSYVSFERNRRYWAY